MQCGRHEGRRPPGQDLCCGDGVTWKCTQPPWWWITLQQGGKRKFGAAQIVLRGKPCSGGVSSGHSGLCLCWTVCHLGFSSVLKHRSPVYLLCFSHILWCASQLRGYCFFIYLVWVRMVGAEEVCFSALCFLKAVISKCICLCWCSCVSAKGRESTAPGYSVHICKMASLASCISFLMHLLDGGCSAGGLHLPCRLALSMHSPV